MKMGMGGKREGDKLVPKLRFSEFRDIGEWDERALVSLGQTVSGLTGKSADDFGSGEPYVTYKQVFDSSWIDFAKCGKVVIADNEKQNKLQYGDILFTISSETANEVGFASVLLSAPPEPVYLNSFCFAFRPDNLDSLSPAFARHLFHSSIFRESISTLAQGSTRFNISKKAFLNLKLPIPNAASEQQKIADCLSSLDDLITAQRQKIDLLKAHKNGLMQQLFPQDGETIPKLRFSGFKNNVEWKETTLGEAATFINGKAYKQEELLDYGKYRVLRVGNFFTNNKWYYSNLELDEKNFCVAGDLLYAWSASFGPRMWRGEKVIYHYHIWKVEERKGTDRNFLYIVLDWETGKIKAQQANGLGLLHITKSAIEEWKCRIPEINEQRKIAEGLSSVSKLITIQEHRLDAIKAHKKGLMQQLFPSLNEADK